MAERPVFIPAHDHLDVEQVSIELHWHSGFAPIQKKRNIDELHRNAASQGFSPLLEVSTKSEIDLGRDLSAFNLKVLVFGKWRTLECVFQGSKVFSKGGPYTDLYAKSPRDARSDERLKHSGELVGFLLEDRNFALEPKTFFYDWLYINALEQHAEVQSLLLEYSGFTDIEFNPQKSINCQARSCAFFVSLLRAGRLREALQSPDKFQSFLAQTYNKSGNASPRKASFQEPDMLELGYSS